LRRAPEKLDPRLRIDSSVDVTDAQLVPSAFVPCGVFFRGLLRQTRGAVPATCSQVVLSLTARIFCRP
jgi:hypothetical protein